MQAVGNFAMLPGPDHSWGSQWVGVRPKVVDDAEIAVWPYSVGMLVKIVAFLDTLRWPAHAGNFGVGGVCFVGWRAACS